MTGDETVGIVMKKGRVGIAQFVFAWSWTSLLFTRTRRQSGEQSFPIMTNPLKGKLRLRIISTLAGKNNQFCRLWSGSP